MMEGTLQGGRKPMNTRFRVTMVRTALFFSVLFLLVSPASAFLGGKIENFSAEQVSVEPGGKTQVVGKIYAGPGMFRMEMAERQGNEKSMVNIFRKDRGLNYMIIPEDKAYAEIALDEKKLKQAMGDVAAVQKEEVLGTESVGGYKCTKKRIETKVSFFGFEKTVKSTIWISDRFDMPLRTEDEGGRVTELRNIREGKQPASLFEPPAGYRKAAGMMELFGASGSGGDKAGKKEKGAEQEGGGFSLPKSITDKLPKNFKLPFGDKN
jgi:outer membrane lipoprotein-sorting protein